MTTSSQSALAPASPQLTGLADSPLFVRLSFILGLVLLLVPGQSGRLSAADDAPIRVLILTGRNNHDWKATTPLLEKIYRQNDGFAVSVTTEPETLRPQDLQDYDVLVSNWNTFPNVNEEPWDAALREAFLRWIRTGHGFVVVHAGGTMFATWPEYHQLIGATWGKETGHGRIHEFTVRIADPNHPVTRGLEDFRITDELWHRMGVNAPFQVLATAFSDPAMGGSGRDEPVAMTLTLGQGRCFNLVLGHDATAVANAGFAALLHRGTQWAATGQVHSPPGEWSARQRIEQALQSLAAYQYGQSRTALRQVEELVHAAARDASLQRQLAVQLAGFLKQDVSLDSRRFACEQLSLVGGPEEVPALGALLAQPDLTLAARQALERIGGEAARQALVDALPQVPDSIQPGLVQSLAASGDRRNVPALAPFVGSESIALASAAMDALGRLGGAQAVGILQSARPQAPPSLQRSIDHALLLCAEQFRGNDQGEQALLIYQDLAGPNHPDPIRLAAFTGQLACAGHQAGALLLSALQGKEPVLQRAALRTLRDRPDADLSREVASQLTSLPAALQVGLIALFADQRVAATLPAVTRATTSEHPEVRQAAWAALGLLGDATTVSTLVAGMEQATAAERTAMAESLSRLRGDNVTSAMIQAVPGAAPVAQIELINVLAAREASAAVPTLLAMLDTAEPAGRITAWRALGSLADDSVVPTLISRLNRISDGERNAAETALAEMGRRTGRLDALREGLAGASGATRISLIAILGMVGRPDALPALRGQLASQDEAVRQAVVQALASWPDAAPVPDLLVIASQPVNAREKTVALRGVGTLVAKDSQRSASQRIDDLAMAFHLADRPAEQQALLAALGSVPSLEALELAQAQLSKAGVAEESALALLQIAQQIGAQHPEACRAAIRRVREGPSSAALKNRALSALFQIDLNRNLATGGNASSPDGIEKDGDASGDQAAIDGNPATYWDEADGQELYRLRIELKEPATVAGLRLMGWQHHHYAPKKFEVLCDGQVVQTVEEAVYAENLLEVPLTPTRCRAVELKITGYYGRSPALRELQILNEGMAAWISPTQPVPAPR